MIIIRISPGFANAMLEFCAGYALAQELEDENVIVDVGLCEESAWGYLLDFMNIPDYKKISYYTEDVAHRSINDPLSIPEDLRKNAYIVNSTIYQSLDRAHDIKPEGKVIWLCDMLFESYYHLKYWDDLLPMFKLRNESINIQAFKKLIKDRTSVGIHIRRGDMLYADFAVKTCDDYYRAAIEYVKERVDINALFCVFSDDIAYAEQLLGHDRNIHYIHFLGYDDCDVEEFICLSLCNHRIITPSSTYGDLADRISTSSRKKCICYAGNIEDSCGSVARKEYRRFMVLKSTCYRLLLRMFRNKFSSRRSSILNKAILNYRIYLSESDVSKYAKRYTYKSDKQLSVIKKEDVDCAIDEKKARLLLERISELELSYSDDVDENDIKYVKLKCYFTLGDYERALNIADSLWGGGLIEEREFRDVYAKCLHEVRAVREAKILENSPLNMVHFILFPGIKSSYSTALYGMGELAVALVKYGCKVDIIEDPIDDAEEAYICNHAYMTNRHEVMLGVRQTLYRSVLERGMADFIYNAVSSDLGAKKCIIITRDPEVLYERVCDVQYIYWDDSDERDPEAVSIRGQSLYKKNQINSAMGETDYVMTCHEELYQNKPYEMITYSNASSKYPYWSTDRKWELHNLHRLSERTMNVCESVLAQGGYRYD